MERKTQSGTPKGELEYRDRGAGVDVRSKSITSFAVNGDTATFAGTCKNKGVPCTFQVVVTDKSKSGSGDEFQIKIQTGATEYIAGGVITSGNIKVSP